MTPRGGRRRKTQLPSILVTHMHHYYGLNHVPTGKPDREQHRMTFLQIILAQPHETRRRTTGQHAYKIKAHSLGLMSSKYSFYNVGRILLLNLNYVYSCTCMQTLQPCTGVAHAGRKHTGVNLLYIHVATTTQLSN